MKVGDFERGAPQKRENASALAQERPKQKKVEGTGRVRALYRDAAYVAAMETEKKTGGVPLASDE